jgi:hypothetical protein
MRIFYKITTFVLTFAVVFLFSGTSLVSPKAIAKDKGVLKEIVFVHNPSPGHGRPLASCTVTTDDSINDWLPSGLHMNVDGLTYQINFSTLPANISSTDFQNVIAASTNTWKQADSSLKWTYGGSTSARKSGYDGVNLVAFGSASGGIAVTRSWYWTGTGEIAESDMILNRNFAWSITDPNAGDCAGVPYTYDVQSIATHEFGHQVGLKDLYDKIDKDLTMYGYGTYQELKADTLGTGDITGAQALAP